MTNEMQPRGEVQLTVPSINPTLNIEGNIFMPENSGELKINSKPKERVSKPSDIPIAPISKNLVILSGKLVDLDEPNTTLANVATGEVRLPTDSNEGRETSLRRSAQERIDKARAAWDKYNKEFNKGGVISVDERRTQEMMIEKGIMPIAGGAYILSIMNYPDLRLNNIVRELNTEVNRVGIGSPLEPTYIDRHLKRVQGLLDTGQVDNTQALTLLGELNNWMAESRATQQQGYGRYISAEEENLILTEEDERERIFEEIFVGVDANPGVEFLRALSLEASGKLDNFFTVLNHARVYDTINGQRVDITEVADRRADVAKKREQLLRDFSGKREIRRILHDANWSVSGGGDIQAFAQSMSTFQSEYIDLIFQDKLVGTALHMFEQAFQQIKADNGGQLPYEELAWDYKGKSSKLEDKVWDLLREQVPDDVPEWRIRRAIIFARGFGVASLRFPEIAAQARLPEETTFASATDRASRLGSIYGEAIARYLDPVEHIIEKFAIGEDDRAFLYYFLTGDKRRFQSKKQLKLALEMSSHLTGEDKRLIDVINIFRIGGGFSQSSWRTFTAMKNFTPEQRRRSGIGIREGRVQGDVDDEIRAEVRRDPEFAGKSDDEMAKEVERRQKGKRKDDEIRAEVRRDPEFAGKSDDEMAKEVMRRKNKETRVKHGRLEMWKDALKANPLRVVWQWEEKVPGQRLRLLAEALGVREDAAKALLSNVEKDLIIIQEDTVQRLNLSDDNLSALGKSRANYSDPEMLNYNIITGNIVDERDSVIFTESQRRTNVQNYVQKIREKASASDPRNPKLDYAFIRSLFEKTPAEKSPFPFVIGFEDIPFSDFNFINTGGRGFARRINDYAASVTATNELIGLITKIPRTHNIEPLIDSLDKIKQAVANYDKSIAMEIVPYIARGIVRFYDKGLAARMPLGVGTVVDLLTDSSYAQTLFGREAMAWDEGDKFNFTRHLLLNSLATKSEVKKMREELGATPLNFGIDVIRTYGQLALLLLLYNFMKETSKSVEL